MPAIDNYSAIRALKVFRIFRCVEAVPSLRVMVMTLGFCVHEVVLVSGPIFFVVIMFAIVGLHLFVGVLRQKCVCMPGMSDMVQQSTSMAMSYNYSHGFHGNHSQWDSWFNDESHYVSHDNGDTQICGNMTSAFQCPTNSSQCGYQPSICLNVGDNPDSGYTSFDNFGWACIAVLQVITLDFWENVYRKVIMAMGASTSVYFAFLVMFGAFFMMNILVAVVSSRYFITKEEEAKERADALACKAQQPRRRSTLWETSMLSAWRMNLQSKIENLVFALLINLAIVANTITMALSHPRMSTTLDDYITISNYVFTAIFTLEVIIKMTAYGIKDYFVHKHTINDSVYRSSRGWNIFDFVIVVVSILEVILYVSGSGSTFSGLSIIRVVRLLRILKFMSKAKGMQRLLNAISNGAAASIPLLTIAAIVVYAFAAIGLQLYREDYRNALINETDIWDPEHNVTLKNPSDKMPRWHYLDFQHSFLMIFKILCGEWIEPMWDTMNFSGKGAIIGPIVFYLLVVLIGNFVVFNLFIAVLLGAFEDEVKAEQDEKINNALKKKLEKRRSLRSSPNLNLSSRGPMPSVASDTPKTSNKSNESFSKLGAHNEWQGGMVSVKKFGGKPVTPLCCCLPVDVQKKPIGWTGRKYANYSVHSTPFHVFIFICIIASSITLCFEDAQLEKYQGRQDTLYTFDITFAVIFTIEMTLKILAFGWKGYFYDGWNILDFVLVVISITSLASAGASSVRALRVLRALRPLRAVKKWESMRAVVNAMLAALPSLFHVLVVCMLSWLSFSILGVQLFGGQFYKCVDHSTLETLDAAIIPDKATCCAIQNSTGLSLCGEENAAGLYYWRNSHVNFDNTLNGFMALFMVGTYEGFEGVMMDSVDSVGFDMQPIFENRFYAFYFYALFIMLGAFFALNLVITAVIDTFQAQKAGADKKKQTDGIPFTNRQERLMLVTLAILQKKPQKMKDPPQEGLQAICYKIADSSYFQVFIIVLILLNTICYTLKWHGMDTNISVTVFWLNVTFTILYLLEAIIKIYGMRMWYFTDSWNKFDFGIVFISLVSLFIDIGTGSKPGESNGTEMLSAFRMLRCLKLMRFIPKLDVVMITLQKSASALVNVALLLFMVMFIFGIVSMSLFKHLKQNGTIDEQFNFETFGHALLVLFQLCTATGWNDVVDACSLQPPDCDPNYGGYANGNCGSPLGSQLFFSTYTIVMSLALISAYIAILLEHLQDEETISAAANIPQKEYDKYYKAWQKYDPDADQFIDEDELQPFLSEIKPPLGFGSVCNAEHLLELNIPLYVKPPPVEKNTKGTQLRTAFSEEAELQAHCADILCVSVFNVEYFFPGIFCSGLC